MSNKHAEVFLFPFSNLSNWKKIQGAEKPHDSLDRRELHLLDHRALGRPYEELFQRDSQNDQRWLPSAQHRGGSPTQLSRSPYHETGRPQPHVRPGRSENQPEPGTS